MNFHGYTSLFFLGLNVNIDNQRSLWGGGSSALQTGKSGSMGLAMGAGQGPMLRLSITKVLT
jgi:hypothetical protein